MSSILESSSQERAAFNLRRAWVSVHRWMALSVGWLLALVALAGAILIVARPLNQVVHPELFKASGSPPASAVTLESIRANLIATIGNNSTFTLRPPRSPDETMWVIVRGDAWSGTVYVDPATGRELGRIGEYEGVTNLLFKFHSALMSQDIGKAVLAWIALAYLALVVSGLVIWWPKRWSSALKIELRKGLLRGVFDLHRTGGAILGALIAVTVATGAYMAWRPLGEFVTTLSGHKPAKPPKLAATAKLGAALPLDQLVANAQALFPNGHIGYIQVPAEASRPVRVRMRLTDDPHPNGLTSVWLHPSTGAVLAAHRWDELDPGARAYSYVFPLHTGELGGVVMEAVTFIAGLALGLLGISGIWLWWRRRS